MMRWALLIPLALAACGNASKIESARAGSTIKLTGEQGVINLKGKTWSPAITVDASRATFTGIVLMSTKGIHFKGGTIVGPGAKSYGIRVLQSSDVSVDGMTITGAHRGVVIDRSQDITIKNTQLTGLISDGIDIASSQRILIDRNVCEKFSPQLATWDAAGVKTDGDHPDCIQSWNRLPASNTADVVVTNNRADGTMQGIFFRDPGENGGFDRITIANNVMRTGLSNAIYVEGARDAIVRNNRISTVPGATQLKTGRPLKTNLIFKSSTGITCGNQIADIPSHEATKACR